MALSALQHFLFCPRQCALIHVEQVWAENVLTAEGRLLHEKTDLPGTSSKKGGKVSRALPLHASKLGIAGVADVVEWYHENGGWRPFPVEYKRGRPKAHRADEVQLCAQAMCLEAMTGPAVFEGALFYGTTRRRVVVTFDDELRALVHATIEATRAMIERGETPAAVHLPKRCDACSLKELCRPERLAARPSVTGWLRRMVREASAGGENA